MRIVAKVGSSSLVDSDGHVRGDMLRSIADDIAGLRKAGVAVTLVSSGAIATGLGVLGRTRRPTDLPSLQAASSVGQGHLFGMWGQLLGEHGITAGQVLLTMHDVSHRSAYVNARNTLQQLLAWGVVPIVNENDTTATDEITFGDNDALAAQVAVLVRADLLVLLTDTEGLYTAHPDTPGAELIHTVTDHSLLDQIDTAASGSHWGSGGMRSKVIAAEMANAGGTTAFIASSSQADVLQRIASGEHLGTRFTTDGRRGSSFKLWLRYAKKPRGTLVVDDGARAALLGSGASLLPVGIVQVDGGFAAGDAVAVAATSEPAIPIAKGIVEYSSAELQRLIGDRARVRGAMEAIHRDQLVTLQ